MSIFIGGGQDYHGPTAERDKKVVQRAGEMLRESDLDNQIITGGTGGIPDDFAMRSGDRVLDVVSSEHLKTYKERTKDRPRSYWVAAKTQEARRLALIPNPDIKVCLFIQGGTYTADEIRLFQKSGRKMVVFTGSGGASGGKIDYKGWSYSPPANCREKAYHSEDPDADYVKIARSLVDEVIELWNQ